MKGKRPVTTFNSETARAAGAKGNETRWAKRRVASEPYTEPFLTFLDAIGRGGPTREAWRVFWKAADGLPLEPAELTLFQRHTGRTVAPTAPAAECWMPAGRRGGKSENMTARATWRAIHRDWKGVLSAGEVGVIPLIASDRMQARNTLAYLKGLADHPLVHPHVARVLRDSVEFRTGAVVQVMTASWKSTRGYTMLDCVLEECAFYSSEDSANPDEEVLAAIRPALLTVPGARVYGISSPYARRGILYRAYADHWGHDGSDVLVFSADTVSLNPTVDRGVIARAFQADAAKAASEYGQDGLVSFRTDVEAFLSREAIDAVTVLGRRELGPRSGVDYVAFVDVSGGSQDAYTLAIAHQEAGKAVLDALRATVPPFSPDAVTAEYATLLKRYYVHRVTGDKYAGEWPAERFAQQGIQYLASERSKSELYRELLAPINAARVELLDEPKLRTQLATLERRVARGGKDSIDHAPGAHDDSANAAAGALVLAGAGMEMGGLYEYYRERAAALRAAQPGGSALGVTPTRPLFANPTPAK